MVFRASTFFGLLLFSAVLGPAICAADSTVIKPDPVIAQYTIPAKKEPRLSHAQQIQLAKSKIKYIFVIYQENRSFDSYFGTFPGAEGLYSQPANKTPGFVEPLIGTDGVPTTIQPFRIGPAQGSVDLADTDHSHKGIVTKIDIVNGVPMMDHFAITEETKHTKSGNPSLAAKQYGELEMAHVDGDTIPFLWRYANRFVLCDHIFQLMTGPSTPGNLAIIGAQIGQTQWMLHPEEAFAGNGQSGPGLPVTNDALPFWGSSLDTNTDGRMPYSPNDIKKSARPGAVQRNLTYATVPLTLAGSQLNDMTQSDRDPAGDLADVKDDVATITAAGGQKFGWGWYQEGFGTDPTPPAGGGDPVDANGEHFSYVTHHDGPQYFGYIANNPKMSASMHGIGEILTSLKTGDLPAQGGLFFIKGGHRNFLGLTPANPDPDVQDDFLGDDDHPADSDSQISEAMAATMVNAIARSKYWNKCAIIITWDDSEGSYDHVQPPLLASGPDGKPISDGPRVPFLLISPYARTHSVLHDTGDHASVIKLTDAIFGLIPLADLPDEEKGRKIGEAKGLKNEGPFDDQVEGITDLLGAFDPARLSGRAAPLPSDYAIIPDDLVNSMSAHAALGLSWVGVEPTDYQLGIQNPLPADFTARP